MLIYHLMNVWHLEMLDVVKYSYAMETAQPNVSDNCYGTTDTVENCISQMLKV